MFGIIHSHGYEWGSTICTNWMVMNWSPRSPSPPLPHSPRVGEEYDFCLCLTIDNGKKIMSSCSPLSGSSTSIIMLILLLAFWLFMDTQMTYSSYFTITECYQAESFPKLRFSSLDHMTYNFWILAHCILTLSSLVKMHI